MIGIAERYILKRVFFISAMTLVSLVVIVLITQVLIFVNVVTDSGEAIQTFIKMAGMLVPMVAGVVLPFALLIGICQALNTMHTDSEIVVLEAAGASSSVAIKPVMMLGLVAGIVAFANSVFVEPAANRQLRDIIIEAGSNMIRLAVRSESFQRVEDNLYLQIGGQLPGGGFNTLFIADLREPEAQLLYYAQRGSITKVNDTDLLVLENGEVQRENAQTGEVSIVSFTTYALDLGHFTAAQRGGSYQPKEQTTAYLLNPDPNDSFAQHQPQVLRSEFHRRMTDWLYPLAFCLIALYFSVGARSNREERMWSIGAAAGVALAVRGAGFFLVNEAGGALIFTILNYAAPILTIIFFAMLLASGKRAKLSQSWQDRLSYMTDWLAALGSRFSRRAATKGGDN